MKIAITGASGYIGKTLTRQARQQGYHVLGLGRSPVSFCDDYLHFDLNEPDKLTLPEDIDAVIHLAIVKEQSSDARKSIELEAAECLLAEAKKKTARFIFVSSQTAQQGAATQYGRTKWKIEQIVLSAGESVIRPGMVFGGEPEGLYGTLVNLVERLPLLPRFFPAPEVLPIHIDDLSQGILNTLQGGKQRDRIYCIAAEQPVAFHDFLNAIAEDLLGVKRLFIPFPAVLVKLLHRCFPGLGPFGQLNSLLTLPSMSAGEDLRALSITPRTLRQGLLGDKNQSNRELLLEAKTFYRFLLSAPCSPFLLRPYVRAVKQFRSNRPLDLPALFHWWPALMSMVNAPANSSNQWLSEFAWRLDTATVLAEASPEGARAFLGLGRRSGFLINGTGLAMIVIAEVFSRTAGLGFSLLLLLRRRRFEDEQL